MTQQDDEKCGVKVVAYVTRWCPDCGRSRRVLQRMGLPYVEIDIESTPGSEAAMRAMNGGSGKIPTILVDGPGGRSVLVEPGDRELADAVRHCSGVDSGS
jgi:glutaredoxin